MRGRGRGRGQEREITDSYDLHCPLEAEEFKKNEWMDWLSRCGLCVCGVREQLFRLVVLDDYSLRLLSKVVRQRFVTMSFCDIMKSITGGVKNFLGAHIVTYLEKGSESLVSQGFGETSSQSLACTTISHVKNIARVVMRDRMNSPKVVAQPQITPDYVLQQPYSLRLHQLVDHIAKNGTHSIETFVGVTNVGQASLI